MYLVLNNHKIIAGGRQKMYSACTMVSQLYGPFWSDIPGAAKFQKSETQQRRSAKILRIIKYKNTFTDRMAAVIILHFQHVRKLFVSICLLECVYKLCMYGRVGLFFVLQDLSNLGMYPRSSTEVLWSTSRYHDYIRMGRSATIY